MYRNAAGESSHLSVQLRKDVRHVVFQRCAASVSCSEAVGVRMFLRPLLRSVFIKMFTGSVIYVRDCGSRGISLTNDHSQLSHRERPSTKTMPESFETRPSRMLMSTEESQSRSPNGARTFAGTTSIADRSTAFNLRLESLSNPREVLSD